LFLNNILLQLILDERINGFLVSSYSINGISSAPEFSFSVFVLQIFMPVKDHQGTLPLQKSHEI